MMNELHVKYTPETLNVFSVRGPVTRDHLMAQGIDVPEIYGDPALFMPEIYTPKKIPQLKNKICLVPHSYVIDKYDSSSVDSKKFHILPTIKEYIGQDPDDEDAVDWRSFINQITSCRAVISSSLHGLIISDAYNKPNVWLTEHSPQKGYKYDDHFLSQGRPLFNLTKLADFKESMLYRGGNKLDMEKLRAAYPCGYD